MIGALCENHALPLSCSTRTMSESSRTLRMMSDLPYWRLISSAVIPISRTNWVERNTDRNRWSRISPIMPADSTASAMSRSSGCSGSSGTELDSSSIAEA